MAGVFAEGPSTPMGGPSGRLRSFLARRREDREFYAFALDLVRRWRWVCEGTALCREASTVSGAPVSSTPVVTHVDLGGRGLPIVLTVALLGGMVAEDVQVEAARLAEGMGVAVVRVRPFLSGFVKVTLLVTDPLAGVLDPVPPVASALHPLFLGTTEDGVGLHLELATSAHVVIQGCTGSGKSVGCYSLLSQLSVAPDVVVSGSDVTGLLLAPWAKRQLPPGVPAPALGTADLGEHARALDLLVAEMDRRVSAIPAGRDSVLLGPDMPVLLVVLEELPGLYRALDTTDRALGKRVRAAVARLLAEGRKAGVRVVLVTQRADAVIVGAYERGQASHRLSFRVDSGDAVRMLHLDALPDQVAAHARALPGIALATVPGSPLLRLRSPHVDYGQYVDAVAGASA